MSNVTLIGELKGEVVKYMLCIYKVVGLHPSSNGWFTSAFLSKIYEDHSQSYADCALSEYLVREFAALFRET